MSWMDLSAYLVIEEAAAARVEGLRDEAAGVNGETPAPPRAPIFKWDVRRRIDDVIDYFGEACPATQRPSVRGCG